jgi:FlaA1/EpsC-like NDP-sugar epimerase
MLSNIVQKLIGHLQLDRLVSILMPYRMFAIIGVHILIFTGAYLGSLWLITGRIWDDIYDDMGEITIGPLILIRLLVFYDHDLFRGMWRYVSFEDLINIIRATVISTLLFYLTGLFWDRYYMAELVYLLDMTFCVFLCGGMRLVVRSFTERFVHGRTKRGMKRVYLVGPIGKIQPILKDLISDPQGHYYPLAVVDPQKEPKGLVRRLCDVPVLSIQQSLDRVHKVGGPVDNIIINWPEGPRKQVDALVDQMKVLNAKFKIIPHYVEILDDRVSINDIREVEIEDLLDRPPITIDMVAIGAYLAGKSVMVTGGAGSIGSEICRQVAGFGPRRLVIVERSENSLYDFEREIMTAFPDLHITSSISTINDAAGIKRTMEANGIEVVFHAAAYKHVPLMEKAPLESAYNNIIGTDNVVNAAVETGVKRFVMISTDKAVNPANVMGVTKRIAEMVVQSHHRRNATLFMTVRFGNVLGSAGSVIPIFKRQIANGQAVTVTHQDIERFFMTIPEAVQLVLQAGCMAQGGEIFVLDMGRPMKILKLAERLITLSGKRPYDDIDIVFSGLRPGEKMYEELFNRDECLLSTPHPRIKAAQFAKVNQEFMTSQVEKIRNMIAAKDEDALHRKFHELVPGYQRLHSKDDLMPNRQRALKEPEPFPATAEKPFPRVGAMDLNLSKPEN